MSMQNFRKKIIQIDHHLSFIVQHNSLNPFTLLLKISYFVTERIKTLKYIYIYFNIKVIISRYSIELLKTDANMY